MTRRRRRRQSLLSRDSGDLYARHFVQSVPVALSILIASLASYVALDLAGRVIAPSKQSRGYWILASATAMGIGIWSIHFLGMLALQIAAPVAYDVLLLALSIAIAISGSAVTFFMSARAQPTSGELLLASLFMGPAIAGMHYTGMAAVRMPSAISYDRGWVAMSAAVSRTTPSGLRPKVM